MAAGKGSRLGDLTEGKPKSFLKIKGRKILDININMLHKYGIWDITIVTGFRDEMFKDLTKSIPGVSLVYNPFYEFTNVIGSYFMGMGRLHDDFIYMHADTICDVGIFEDLLVSEGDVVLPVDKNKCDDEAMKVKVIDGQIVSITKQMPNNEAEGEFIGIAKIRKNVITDLNESAEQIMRERFFASYFEGALQRLLKSKKFDFRIVDTRKRFWSEIDCLVDYERAKKNITEDLFDIPT